MGWLIERKIKTLLDKGAKHQEIATKAFQARIMMDNKAKGAVKATEDVIKTAKRLKYDKSLIKQIESTLANYKKDTPKNLW